MSAQIITLLSVCDELTNYTQRLKGAPAKPLADWDRITDQLLDLRNVLMRERDGQRPTTTNLKPLKP